MSDEKDDKWSFFQFSWGKLAAAISTLGLIAVVFDLDGIWLMAKLFLYSVLVPIIGLLAAAFTLVSPMSGIMYAVLDSVKANLEELKNSAKETTDGDNNEQSAAA